MCAFDCGSEFALAFGRGLFVKLTGAQVGQQTGFFNRALETAQGDFEWFIFLETDSSHESLWFLSFRGESKNSYYSNPAIFNQSTACTATMPPIESKSLLILGIETSCDESGVALFDTQQGLLGHSLHSQVMMHADYGGVVPELASRDHIRRVPPLTRALLADCSRTLADLNAIAYTQGPGLAGALLVGASIAHGLAYALDIPAIGIHHLEGHLLSPLLADPIGRAHV